METVNPLLALRDIVQRYLRSNDSATLLTKYKYVRFRGVGGSDYVIGKLQGVSPDMQSVLVEGATGPIPVVSLSNQRATKAECDAFLVPAMIPSSTNSSTIAAPWATDAKQRTKSALPLPVRGVLPMPLTASTVRPVVDTKELDTLRAKLVEVEATMEALRAALQEKEEQLFEVQDEKAELRRALQAAEEVARDEAVAKDEARKELSAFVETARVQKAAAEAKHLRQIRDLQEELARLSRQAELNVGPVLPMRGVSAQDDLVPQLRHAERRIRELETRLRIGKL